VEFKGAFYHVIVRGNQRAWCRMKATEIARRLKRDPSMVRRLCASYEAVRDVRTEKKIAEVIGKQLTTQA
jgi:hypothetical protein